MQQRIEPIDAKGPMGDLVGEPGEPGTYIKTKEKCTWTEDENHTWHTECDEAFTIMEDMTPYECKFGFCIYCGKKALYVPFKEDSWFPDDEFILIKKDTHVSSSS